MHCGTRFTLAIGGSPRQRSWWMHHYSPEMAYSDPTPILFSSIRWEIRIIEPVDSHMSRGEQRLLGQDDVTSECKWVGDLEGRIVCGEWLPGFGVMRGVTPPIKGHRLCRGGPCIRRTLDRVF
jgi:hypothetical protein